MRVKTHKDSGEVVRRIVHANSRSPFKPGARLVAKWLRPGIRIMSHLIRDSDHLVELLKVSRIPLGHRLVKIDIKDFVMSGSPSDLRESSSKYVLPRRAVPFRGLVSSLLESQFVSFNPLLDDAFKVVRGNGMGCIASNELSCVDFYDRAEAPFVLLELVQVRYGISLYLRFKDDIILAMGGDVASFLSEFSTHAAHYKLKLDCQSLVSVPMLDLRLIVPSSGGFVSVDMFFKPTNQAIPMSSLSCHLPSVHTSWPMARVKRFRKLVSCAYFYTNAYQHFRRSLVLGAPKHVWLRFSPPAVSWRHTFARVARPKCMCSWLVLPYDPDLKSSWLDSWVLELKRTFEFFKFEALAPRVSWSNGYRNLASIVTFSYFCAAQAG